ncbi:DNA-processing protein DprA [Cognatiluteimonas weifangensis]|uniref:DNA-protecting protein DprA n=1 Tax=Cognatiluteimonas weifangensis TaxID=2303539 RepID=A0A372DPR3_9GAMM|nr:DNA-processing protein DprA [Luteimonas weifangensis]RFP61551.1 DNA-protecting protein DprA [Luteimonas weifangensis]
MLEDTDALLLLHAAGGAVAPRRALLDAHATPAAALAAGPRAWRRQGLDADQRRALRHPDGAALARSRAWLQAPRRHLVGWHDPDYPALLRRTASPPLALFVAGDPAVLWHPAVAVVGSRSPSAGGRDNAGDFARALAAAGLAVTSGLATGIDTAAHEGALAAGGLTVAVLGTGPDVPYPRANAGLHARIAAAGAVVSEHAPGTRARPEHFPSRNRILAGLALGTLVIEAAQRSGALITARLAADAGREVFAVPGSIHNPLARGCHRLIRDGAGLVESAQEVVAAIAPVAAALADALRSRLATPTSPATTTAGSVPGVLREDPDSQRLWQALGHDPTGMDRLVSRTGLTAAELSSMLLHMELEGRVVVEHGRYSRKG